jgi:hypothetical protein
VQCTGSAEALVIEILTAADGVPHRRPHPDETAISIAAQILAERGRGSAHPLDRTDGPIHH